jgi:hypothetical protein
MKFSLIPRFSASDFTEFVFAARHADSEPVCTNPTVIALPPAFAEGPVEGPVVLPPPVVPLSPHAHKAIAARVVHAALQSRFFNMVPPFFF